MIIIKQGNSYNISFLYENVSATNIAKNVRATVTTSADLTINSILVAGNVGAAGPNANQFTIGNSLPKAKHEIIVNVTVVNETAYLPVTMVVTTDSTDTVSANNTFTKNLVTSLDGILCSDIGDCASEGTGGTGGGIDTAPGIAYIQKSDGTGEYIHFPPGADGTFLGVENGDLIYKAPITITADSQASLEFNVTTGELSIKSRAISSVTTDTTSTDLATFIGASYTVGDELQEGDTVVLKNATNGTEVYLHNGGTTGTDADFERIEFPNLDAAGIKALFSATNGINFNPTTGAITGVVDPDVSNDLGVSSAGFLVDVSEGDITDINNIVPGSTGGTSIVTLQSIIDELALTSTDNVKIAGDQNIGGVKTFEEATIFEDEVQIFGGGSVEGGFDVDGVVTSSVPPTSADHLTRKDYVDQEVLKLDKTRIEIPNTEFFDKTNPSLAEVRTWVDANLTAEQLNNTELVMIESLQTLVSQDVHKAFNIVNTADIVFSGGAFTADVSIDDIVIDGTTYTLNIPYTDATGTVVATKSGIETALTTASDTEGVSISWIATIQNNGQGVPTTLQIQGKKTSTPTGITETTAITINTTNFTNQNVFTFNTVVANETIATTLGTTLEEPDYVWTLTDNVLSRVYRRTNLGNVLYVSQGIAEFRAFYAQRGNPDRPFRSPWDARDKALSGDTIIILNGDYTWGAVGSGAIKESDGADLDEISLVRPDLNYHAYPGVKFTAVSTQNNSIFRNASGAKFNFTGHADFDIPSNAVGFIEAGDNSDMTIEFNEMINGGTQWARCITFFGDNLRLNIKGKKITSNLARLIRTFAVTNSTLDMEVDHYICNETDADFGFGSLTNCKFNINFKKSDMNIRFQNGLNDVLNSSIKINFGASRWVSATGGRYDVIAGNITDSYVEINYGTGTIQDNGRICEVVNTRVLDNSEVLIKGRFTHDGEGIVINNSGVRTGDGSIKYEMDINATNSSRTAGIYNMTNDCLAEISGKLKNVVNVAPIRLNALASLRDLKVIMPTNSTADVIDRSTGTGALNVICSNVTTNTTTEDTEFTEVGQPIIRNSNYR